MAVDLTRRTYDLLRLIDSEEPIGSIRLVELMKERGYSIKGRTIRVTLSELDEAGLTEKVPGRGRRLTAEGRAELARGNVSSRLERIRERIATLTSQVTYDPLEDVGEVVAASAAVDEADLGDALDALERLDDSPLGPVLVSTTERDDGRYRLEFPSSITLDGVLLTHGIAVELTTAGLVEYTTDATEDDRRATGDDKGATTNDRRATGADEAADPPDVAGGTPDPTGTETAEYGGGIVRYVDAISGEGSTMDVVSLLIEAGRTSVTDAVESGSGLVIVDNRELPLTRYQEAQDLSVATRDRLGGVLDLRRPRESGPFPAGDPGWDFASVTYSGMGEVAIALLAEAGVTDEWETLQGVAPRSEFSTVQGARTDVGR
ncbi:NrpR regulatory domain-containing protein [Halorussus sp. AFM4]|uniref:NrpR regulatory domain-containing protein n=1 Tax=Halorussus sp. AFM4 TaxID=3421651 RepID=UPI003EB843B0